MNLRPLRDQIYVIAEARPEETVRESGIILKNDAGLNKKAPARAKIIAMGTGKENKHGEIVPMDVEVGNVVLIHLGSGIKTSDGLNDKTDYRIIRYEDILAVVEA